MWHNVAPQICPTSTHVCIMLHKMASSVHLSTLLLLLFAWCCTMWQHNPIRWYNVARYGIVSENRIMDIGGTFHFILCSRTRTERHVMDNMHAAEYTNQSLQNTQNGSSKSNRAHSSITLWYDEACISWMPRMQDHEIFLSPRSPKPGIRRMCHWLGTFQPLSAKSSWDFWLLFRFQGTEFDVSVELQLRSHVPEQRESNEGQRQSVDETMESKVSKARETSAVERLRGCMYRDYDESSRRAESPNLRISYHESPSTLDAGKKPIYYIRTYKINNDGITATRGNPSVCKSKHTFLPQIGSEVWLYTIACRNLKFLNECNILG